MISFSREVSGPVVRGGNQVNGWHYRHAANPSVVVLGSTVYMYMRGDNGSTPIGSPAAPTIGVVTAPVAGFTGLNWTERPAAVITPTQGQKDATGCFDPCAIVFANQIYVYYQEQSSYTLCVAVSQDGFNFTKYYTSFDGGQPAVVVSSDHTTIHLYHAKPITPGDPNTQYSFYHATSNDGINFTADSGNTPVLQPSGIANAFDEIGIVTIRAFFQSPYYYLIYGGNPGYNSQPGMRAHTQIGGTGFTDYPEGFGMVRSQAPQGPFIRYPGNPIYIRGPAGSWDEGAVWSGSYIVVNNTGYLFYEACGSGQAAGADPSNSVRDKPYWVYGTQSYSSVGVAYPAFNGDFTRYDPGVDLPNSGKYAIQNVNTLKNTSPSNGYLTPTLGATADGTPLVQYPWNGADDKRWILSLQVNGFYQISNVKAGTPGTEVMDLRDGNRQTATVVQIHSANAFQFQQWYISAARQGYGGNNAYAIINRYSGQPLETVGQSVSSGAAVDQYSMTGLDNQRWWITPA